MNNSSTTIKSIAMAATLLGSMALYATSVKAETIEGKFNGLECASHGEECPTDKLDPHLAFESDFVVQTADGKYFFITNIDRAIKARHALEMVRVEGKLSSKFDAMNASQIWVKDGGDYKLTWSIAMEDEQRRLMRGTTPEGGGQQ